MEETEDCGLDIFMCVAQDLRNDTNSAFLILWLVQVRISHYYLFLLVSQEVGKLVAVIGDEVSET